MEELQNLILGYIEGNDNTYNLSNVIYEMSYIVKFQITEQIDG
jgi:hypothetical protein